MLSFVIDIVAQCVPDLQALNLDDNKITHLDKLSFLGDKLRKLKILHLAENKVDKIYVLNLNSNCYLIECIMTLD